MNTVRAVDRALTILFLVSTSTEPLGLTEISRETGIDKATALRLLFTLESFKLVRRDVETRRYLPGPGVWRLSSSWQRDLRTISHPHLEALCQATQETPSLICPRGLERVCVHAVHAPNELSIVPAVGSTQPIHFGASGKIILAYLPDKERDKIIEITKLKSSNPRAVTNRADFLKILRTVRRRGYATSSGDVTLGAAAVAAHRRRIAARPRGTDAGQAYGPAGATGRRRGRRHQPRARLRHGGVEEGGRGIGRSARRTAEAT
jgi:IclR family acetate operon transcriptional repressor